MLSILLFQFISSSISDEITQNQQIEESQTNHFPFLDSNELFYKENIQAFEKKVSKNQRKIFNNRVTHFKRNHLLLKYTFDKEVYLQNHILLTEITNALKNISALLIANKNKVDKEYESFVEQYDELCKLQNSMGENFDRISEEYPKRKDSL